MHVLEIQNLTKRFGEKQVLENLSLSIPKGSIFGLVGLNGAGKTTTMKCVLGLMKADSGSIQVMGEKVCFGQTKTNRHIGYLPDVPAFYPYMTAKEYVNFCGSFTGETKTRSEELLELVGLKGEKSKIKGFSRGMKQRLGIAQALLNRPKLLICDEPTSALDPLGRKEILSLLSGLKEETTVLFSTHILSDMEKICTDVAFLAAGGIRYQGSIEELKKRGSVGFTLTLSNESEKEKLLSILPYLKREEGATLSFLEHNLQEVLKVLSCEDMKIERLERKETDLETLFLEVTKK